MTQFEIRTITAPCRLRRWRACRSVGVAMGLGNHPNGLARTRIFFNTSAGIAA
jgi:hypothetical protein